jgi:hypothetical protein
MKTPICMISVLLVALAAVPALAQDSSIQGLVTDPTNAVIPAVQVTVTNVATGVAKTVETNGQGLYMVPFLGPGTYRVAALKSGFSTVTKEGLKLDVEQVARVDITLSVGTVSEKIEVSAAAALIDSQTSVVGQVIDNRRIVELPLNGRNYLQLAQLTPGVVSTPGSRNASSGSFSALGQHAYQMNITLDGIDNNASASGGQLGAESQAVTPSIDSVAEFKVVTNNNSAEYGFRMGGTVVVATKAGGNAFHGALFEFLRNEKLDGTNFFSVGQPKPPLRRNEFGATLGGPVIRNRTFFFASYSGTRLRTGQTNISTVPVVAYREGNMQGARALFDPATTRQDSTGAYVRSPFAGNQIPASRFDAVARGVIALYPAPNLPGTINNYYFSPSQQNATDQGDARVDHFITDRQRFYARYSRRRYDAVSPGTLPLPANGTGWSTTSLIAHSLVANLNQTLTASANNEIRFGFVPNHTIVDIPWTENYNAKLGINGVPDFGDDNQRGMSMFSPVSGYAAVGSTASWPNRNNQESLQFSDLLLLVRGRHTVKTGFEFRRQELFRRAAGLSRGSFGFDGSFSQNPNSRGNTGDAMADFVLGLASTGQLGTQYGETGVTRNYSAFIQDDWRVTARLTLNLGLRWDRFGAPSFRDTPVSRFEFTPGSPDYRIIRPRNDGDCGCRHDNKNFAPRVGLAYELTRKTVIRSGFGLFYGAPDALTMQGPSRFAQQPPEFTNITFPTDRLLQPALVVSQGFPAGLLPTTVIQPNVQVFTVDEFLPSQYAMQWFLDVQRQLPLSSVLTLAYIGAGTRHLVHPWNVNLPLAPGPGAIQTRRPRPFFGAITQYEPVGNASYQAFTAKVDKRYKQGFTFLGAYTWSHAIDFTQGAFGDAGGPAWEFNYDGKKNRGNSTYDVRHQFATSGVYDLPIGLGRKWMNVHGPLEWVLGGWQAGAILTLRSGLPFTPLVSTDISNTGTPNHPNRTGEGSLSSGERSIDRWFDVSAFTLPAQYTYGNSGRNILFGPPLRNIDLKIGKNFTFRENKRVEFRCEMFNATNTPYFGMPNSNVNLPQGGRITSAAAPRQIQFGLKLVY